MSRSKDVLEIKGYNEERKGSNDVGNSPGVIKIEEEGTFVRRYSDDDGQSK